MRSGIEVAPAIRLNRPRFRRVLGSVSVFPPRGGPRQRDEEAPVGCFILNLFIYSPDLLDAILTVP